MIEIELPCCDEVVHVEAELPEVVHCDGCGVDTLVAEDAR